jgi:hypothetical protein
LPFLVACNGQVGDPTPGATSPHVISPSVPELCPEITSTHIPDDLTLVDRSIEPGGGVIATWEDASGNVQLNFISGTVAFEGHGASQSGGTMSIRGHRARLVYYNSGAAAAFWEERPITEPCSQYTVLVRGFTPEEFERVLLRIE